MSAALLVPIVLGPVAGSALLIGALLSYARWQRTGDALALIVSSFAVGLGGLARQELFVVGWALAALVWLTPVPPARRPSADEAEHRGASEGSPRASVGKGPAFAIAYAAAVTGVLGLRLVIALVTGDVGGSVGATQDPLAALFRRSSTDAIVVVAPALALVAIAAVSRRAVASAVAIATVAAVAIVAAIATGASLTLDAVVPLVPLSALLLVQLIAAYPVRRVSTR